MLHAAVLPALRLTGTELPAKAACVAGGWDVSYLASTKSWLRSAQHRPALCVPYPARHAAIAAALRQ